jgi:hypothetical protein
MTSPSPATNTVSTIAATAPMVDGASVERPGTGTLAAAIGGFVASLVAHSIIVVWGIGLWDMATPLSAAPPPSITVDLVDDPWKKRQEPELQVGAQPSGPTAQPQTQPQQPATSPPQPQTAHAAAPPTTSPAAKPSQTPVMTPFAAASTGDIDGVPVDPDMPTSLRIARMLQVPVELSVNEPVNEAGGGGAELSAGLMRSVIDQFKEHLRTCWSTPTEAASDERIKVLLRIVLQRDGRLIGDPTLVQAVATPAGPAVVKRAMTALRQCQPYAFLPAEQYKQWRVLEVAFSAHGVL